MGQRKLSGLGNPSPALPQRGREFRRGLSRVVFEPIGPVGVEGEFFGDPLNNAVGVLQDIVVPETDDAVAVAFDHSGARFVGRAIAVLAAIDFDHQFEAAAGEVGDGTANLEFAGELNPQLLGAQPRPQALSRVGRFPPKFLRHWRKALFRHSNAPSKLPSPLGKGWGWGFNVSESIKPRTPIPTLPQRGRALLAPIAKSA